MYIALGVLLRKVFPWSFLSPFVKEYYEALPSLYIATFGVGMTSMSTHQRDGEQGLRVGVCLLSGVLGLAAGSRKLVVIAQGSGCW